MEKTKQIVKNIWDVRNVDIDGYRYRLIESLRLTCDSSQDNKEKLQDFIEHLMCLAIIKKRECIYKYAAYKKVCYVLATIFEDVGLPSNVRDLFDFGRMEEFRINNIMEALNSWPNANGGHIPRLWTKCQLRSLPGVGKKSVMNLIHFYAHGALPEINHVNLTEPPTIPRNINIERRDSRKDILIRQLHNAVEVLSLENRSLKGSEEITECPICLESERTMISTPCGHKFHTNCLMEWLKSHDNCPVCRNSLVTD